MKSCCVKQKKKKLNVLNLVDSKRLKNGRLMFWCTCAECGINKNKICEKSGKLIQPVEGAGIGSTLGEMALEGVTMHAIPWLGKKAVEMTRYGASELMRNKNVQKKKQ